METNEQTAADHRLAVLVELTEEQRELLARAIMELCAAARRLGRMEERERRGRCLSYEREIEEVAVSTAEMKLIAMGVQL